MTDAFHSAMQWILAAEGGYTNDPADRGGETNLGISKRAHPHVDIRTLTITKAAEIYRRDYWDRLRCDEMPAGLALAVFDAGVNQGPTKAAKLLQLAVRVIPDGIIGPDTLGACHRMIIEASLPEFLSRRAVDYATAATQSVDHYLRGWMVRLFRLQIACLRLSGARTPGDRV